MSTSQNWTWSRGETEEWVVAITSQDGTPSNLSTVQALAIEVKSYRGAPDPPLLALGIGTGITVRSQVGSDVGVADVVATSTQTFALAAGNYAFDVWVTRADGGRKLVIFGDLIVSDVVNFP